MKKVILSLSVLLFSGVLATAVQAQEIEKSHELSPMHQAVMGPWNLIRVNGEQPTHQASIQIARDNIYGRTGCNHFVTQVTTFEQGYLAFTPIASTRMGCSGAQATQENLIFDTFEESVNVSYDEVSEELKIIGHDNTLLFEPAN
ncbi:META domain-containing protein [Vibrio lentus]|uniref:META domain-containing protein n=1 Tax=Vibrio lentus TaxID=136468 RepID=A0A2N7BJT4_9VIBR|nr:META domain-containing protein [Vibrio lentus]PME51705.1 META domain-containing protein [Vibrio lentus]PME56880.1 META domain-containing protein [Vibrio lentus]PME83929.1 META domain-containing protein [Vibrio lentus]PMH89893.1 META domain-containing protein [Vibrio lentus]PMI06120.1 META domain-containing protein [Vibrio lentus]